MSPTLHTERLLLDEYTPGDEESFVALFCDEDVVQWMGEGLQPEAEIRGLFGRVFDVYREKRFDVWAVRLDGRHVGHNVGSFALLRKLGFEHVRDIDDGHTTRVLTMRGPGRRPRRPGRG
jgi:RimJ/RimL family protein N-acetyltransferase